MELGLVDRLGTEDDARVWAAELAGLNPEKAEFFTIEEPKPLLKKVLNQNQLSLQTNQFNNVVNWLDFELSTSGQPLWLYKP